MAGTAHFHIEEGNEFNQDGKGLAHHTRIANSECSAVDITSEFRKAASGSSFTNGYAPRLGTALLILGQH